MYCCARLKLGYESCVERKSDLSIENVVLEMVIQHTHKAQRLLISPAGSRCSPGCTWLQRRWCPSRSRCLQLHRTQGPESERSCNRSLQLLMQSENPFRKLAFEEVTICWDITKAFWCWRLRKIAQYKPQLQLPVSWKILSMLIERPFSIIEIIAAYCRRTTDGEPNPAISSHLCSPPIRRWDRGGH